MKYTDEKNSPLLRAAGPALDSLVTEDTPQYDLHGGDWEEMASEVEKLANERVVMNIGPVHPSTHGVLRLIVELDGEYVRDVRVGTGYCIPVSKRTWNTVLGRRALPTAPGWTM